jgi:group I intron endonuclease
MNKAGIYCLTSPSGKSYVGQAVNLSRRLRAYRAHHCKGQRKIYHALSKYGFDAFKVTVLETCDPENLNELEIFWINYLDSITSGYNLKEGGSRGGRYSEEAKQRISDALTGKKFSAERKARLSLVKIGKKPSEGTKENMRVASRNMATETKNTMMALRRERNPNWGIQPSTPGKFKVIFNHNHKTFYAGKFESYEAAKFWRDSKLSTILL